MRKLIGPSELADWLGVPLSTIYHWRQYSYGPTAVKIGKHLRYDPDEVRQWIDDQQEGASDDAA